LGQSIGTDENNTFQIICILALKLYKPQFWAVYAWLIRGTNLVRVDLACSKFWAVCGRKVGVAIAHGCFGRFVGVMWAWHPADLGGLWALEGRGTVPKQGGFWALEMGGLWALESVARC